MPSRKQNPAFQVLNRADFRHPPPQLLLEPWGLLPVSQPLSGLPHTRFPSPLGSLLPSMSVLNKGSVIMVLMHLNNHNIVK